MIPELLKKIDQVPLWSDRFYCSPPEATPKGVSLVFGSNNKLYQSTAPSGPGTEAGPQDPVNSMGYWQTQPTTDDINARVKYNDFVQSLTINGWQKLPGGLIIQWGSTLPSSHIANVVFPIAFPAALWSITLSTGYGADNIITQAVVNHVTPPTRLGFSYFSFIGNPGAPSNWAASGASSLQLQWLAIGY